MSNAGNAHFTFGPFVLDGERQLLLKDGSPVAIGHRAIALLTALLVAGGKVVTKSELMEAGWPSQAVEENNLSVQIAALRKCLGSKPSGEEWIVTIARVGYRFAVEAPKAARVNGVAVASDRPSIAVLPFESSDNDAAHRLLSDGLSEEIINGLSRFSNLTVVARHSSFRFRDATGLADAAQQLGVRYIVTGSLRQGAGRLRLSTQLIEAANGQQVWSGRFDRDVGDLFSMQDEVTQLIVASLTGQLENLEIRSAMARPTESLEAYHCLLRGIESLRSYGADVNRKAIEMFEKALAVDPNFGLAHGYLALALMVEHGFESSPAAVKERALALALKGVQLAPDDSRCHLYLGDVYLFTGEFELSLAETQRSIALNPNDANALTRLALSLAKVGRAEEGLQAAHQAIRNNPFHPDYYWADLAIVAYAARHYEEALGAARRVAVHGRYWDHARIAACLARLDRMDEARAAAQKVLQLKPAFSIAAEPLTYAHAADRDHVREGMRLAGLPD